MTRQEFAILAKALRATYKKDKFLSESDEQEVWYTMLQDIPYDVMSMAVQKWITTQKWQPSIAELRSLAAEIANEPIPGFEEAWEKVLRIARDYSPYDTERTEAKIAELDDITRQCLKLVDIRSIAYTENIAVDRAHFMKTYEILANRKKTQNQEPETLRTAIEARQPKPDVLIERDNHVGIPVFSEPERENSAFHEELRQRFL